MTIALRNQGRLREARELNATGRLKGIAPPLVQFHELNDLNEGLTTLEQGDTEAAVAAFTRNWQRQADVSWAPGRMARQRTWAATLLGMALAAAGDTTAMLRLADTVEYWGQRSLYGRDRKLHHYLRGMLHAAGGRDQAAIGELTQAIYSPSLGFTRVNLELGRALLRQNRPAEAAAIVEPALRGEIDASNMYVTRTELHELLAQAYDRAGQPAKAAGHYRAVVRAWAGADPYFHARRDAARAWLARNRFSLKTD
jgi:tetratricopeptide (TPR) repeat protein